MSAVCDPTGPTTASQAPARLNLSPASVFVEDADEEVCSSTLRSTAAPSGWADFDRVAQIFLLYTQKQQSSPGSSINGGLGFLDTSKEIVPISLTIVDSRPTLASDVKKGKGKARRAQPTPKEVVVELELCQNLDALRNRKGDTGELPFLFVR
jgi:hypothetical protein